MYDGLFKRKSTIADHVTTPFRALILSNGIIYVAFGGYGNTDPFHGWILAYKAANLAQNPYFLGIFREPGSSLYCLRNGGGPGSGSSCLVWKCLWKVLSCNRGFFQQLFHLPGRTSGHRPWFGPKNDRRRFP